MAALPLKEKLKRCEGCPFLDKSDHDSPLCNYYRSSEKPAPLVSLGMCPKGLWGGLANGEKESGEALPMSFSSVTNDQTTAFSGLVGAWKQFASLSLVAVMAGMLTYQTLILMPRQSDLVRQDLMEEKANGKAEAERWRNEIREMRAHDLEQRRAVREQHKEDMELYKKDMAIRSKEHDELIRLSSEILKAIKNGGDDPGR